MRSVRFATLVVVTLALAATAPAAHASVRELKIHSKALENNLSGDPAEQSFAVYLPPSYETSSKRYPVVFLLHGIADSYEVWTKIWKIPQALDSLINDGKLTELIVVMPNARNRFLGSYYVNSPVTGRWSDYVADELVAEVDKNFRTIAKREARGVMGHSMGGFGAIEFGMTRSDVFSAVYALSPCCLDAVEDVSYGNQSAWRGLLAFKTYADADAALGRGEFYPVAALGLIAATLPEAGAQLGVRMPVKLVNGELMPNEPAFSELRARMPLRTASAHREALRSLRALRFDYGIADQFAHIPAATAKFSEVLADLRVPHVFEVYDGDHREKARERLLSIGFPLMARVLEKAQ